VMASRSILIALKQQSRDNAPQPTLQDASSHNGVHDELVNQVVELLRDINSRGDGFA